MESVEQEVDRGETLDLDDLRIDLSSEFGALQHKSKEGRELLKVYLRVRPLTSSEADQGEAQDCVTIESSDTVLLKPPPSRLSDKSLSQTGQRFQFSKVHGPECSQKELFEGTVRNSVKEVLQGEDSLVFTYGVSNAGKTFTFLGSECDAGILPRSLRLLFNSIEGRVFTQTSVKPHRCRDFIKLTREQQHQETIYKRNLFKHLKENDCQKSQSSTSRTNLEGSSESLQGTSSSVSVPEDRVSVDDVDGPATFFSVWVSFCEIYNESIHDLLEAPAAGVRRQALRLSQDVKGNSFVRDLHWVQVNGPDEALKVVKLGKRNQSFSSTKLNQLSSRSHSIFSVRLLRVEDGSVPRVHSISELSLCDLAGSERCAKTQNRGERLKEAGNINTSLLTLGKCISALRHNQQAKLLNHVPFRESKLTHYLQSYLSGRGNACMIVNINQCASVYDETLNVLKFSALAQKVVVLVSRPLPVVVVVSDCSASELSFLIDNADRKTLLGRRRSSMIGWESSLEDVQEDDDGESDEEQSLMERTLGNTVDVDDDDEDNITFDVDEEENIIVNRAQYQRQVALVARLQEELRKEREDKLQFEAQIRQEVSKEFTELIEKMQSDFNERLIQERDMLEDRAEGRMRIFKNLVQTLHSPQPSTDSVALQSVSTLDGRKRPHDVQTDRDGQPPLKKEQLLEESSGGETRRRPEESSGGETRRRPEESSGGEMRRRTEESSGGETRRRTEERTALQDQASEHQEVLAALQEERRAREEVLAALQYQTTGKEEAMASLEEERRAREEVLVSLEEERRVKEEVLVLLGEERRAREEVLVSLEEERRAREEVVEALVKEKRSREEEETRRRLVEDREKELCVTLEAAQREVARMTVTADQTSGFQHQTRNHNVEEKDSQIHSLTQEVGRLEQEVESLKQEVQTSRADGEREALQEKQTSEIHIKALSEETDRQTRTLEQELAHAKQQLVQVQLTSEQQIDLLKEQLREKTLASEQQLDEVRNTLQEKDQQLDELRNSLQEKDQQLDELRNSLQEKDQQLDELRNSLQEKDQTRQGHLEELKGKLQTQEQEVEDLTSKLAQQEVTSERQLEELRQKLGTQQEEAENLKQEVDSAASKAALQDNLTALNSDLRAEAETLRAKVTELEKERERSSRTKRETEDVAAANNQLASSVQEMERTLKDKEAGAERTLAEKEKRLAEKEAQICSLQRALKEAQERVEEEERQAVKEARDREVERRRELLAVAEEAIALKDQELKKRQQDIDMLKQTSKQDQDRVKTMSLDLQRKEDLTTDLRDKLTDSKKQILQVQKEISAMREEEKHVKQQLCNAEKTKKQLQNDLSARDRTIQHLQSNQASDSKSDHMQKHQELSKELRAKEDVLENMRSVLLEQEDTQEQMEQELQERLDQVQELTDEVERLKGRLHDPQDPPTRTDSQSHDELKQGAAQAQESLKVCTEKHQAERRKWLDEKMLLIGQAKEAEDKRNQEMRKFIELKERQQRELDTLSSQLSQKDEDLSRWRQDRDTLVSALEVQLRKLVSANAEKDKTIQELSVCATTLQTASDGHKSNMEVSHVKEKSNMEVSHVKDKSNMEVSHVKEQRVSAVSQGSAGCSLVLDSSQISTENGRHSRFPKPEVEISFSPLTPNRMALRRQGEEGVTTVKITRSTRKRKSGDMWQEEVDVENKRNTRTRHTPKPTHQEQRSTDPHSRKEGTLQKIGGFLQSSPTLLGSKAKKMMSFVSGRGEGDTEPSSSSPLAKKSKKKVYRPQISSPMDFNSRTIITSEVQERDADELKRRLRSRTDK